MGNTFQNIYNLLEKDLDKTIEKVRADKEEISEDMLRCAEVIKKAGAKYLYDHEKEEVLALAKKSPKYKLMIQSAIMGSYLNIVQSAPVDSRKPHTSFSSAVSNLMDKANVMANDLLETLTDFLNDMVPPPQQFAFRGTNMQTRSSENFGERTTFVVGSEEYYTRSFSSFGTNKKYQTLFLFREEKNDIILLYRNFPWASSKKPFTVSAQLTNEDLGAATLILILTEEKFEVDKSQISDSSVIETKYCMELLNSLNKDCQCPMWKEKLMIIAS